MNATANINKNRTSLKVKTHIKAGKLGFNHNQTLVRPTARPSLKVKTSLKAGLSGTNHNQTLVRAS